jgi:hypothetical protein
LDEVSYLFKSYDLGQTYHFRVFLFSHDDQSQKASLHRQKTCRLVPKGKVCLNDRDDLSNCPCLKNMDRLLLVNCSHPHGVRIFYLHILT